MDQIYLVSPTTSPARVRAAAAVARGFLYAVSTAGVTGARAAIDREAREVVGRIRAETTLPVAVGFGISTPEQVREVGQFADAAVVGSALVNLVAESASDSDLEGRIEAFVRSLRMGGETATDKRR
jgi:tryptophan synthase alpha chain